MVFWYAFTLRWISCFPFLWLYGHKKGHPIGSDSFEAQGLAGRDDFLKN
jgi:hypothetical protein